mmetsp:Transcript_46185/g.76367  ORF Transcript_46185/g.76367 Transcript_46185/m.76367 type:complete len:344 (+) Transcript_46185:41-1072(+)
MRRTHTEQDYEPDNTFDPSELSPFSDWRQLSDGGYSEVYKAHLLGITVAVKQATSRKKTSCEALLREIRYLRLAGPHPNIMQPYGAFYERGKLHMVMEYARQCLRADRVARQSDPVIVLAGVARALVRLHGVGIIHRDLKARNVLVATENRAVLIDFGLACHTSQDSDEWIGRTVGTKKYRPPEMRDGRAASPATDMYCFGLMMDKLLRQRERSSVESSPCSDAGRAERRDVRLLHEVAGQCTKREPTERPSAWSVLMRLQRHAGEDIVRCHDGRQRVPLSGCVEQPLGAASSEGREEVGSNSRRKRRRNGDGNRYVEEEEEGGCAPRSGSSANASINALERD